MYAILVLAALPPTPNRDSSIDEVKAWLKIFVEQRRGLFYSQVERLVCPGSDLLSLTKAQCLKRSPEWGDMIYNALHLNPTACEGIFELHHHLFLNWYCFLNSLFTNTIDLISLPCDTEFFQYALGFSPTLLRPDRSKNTLVVAVRSSRQSDLKSFPWH